MTVNTQKAQESACTSRTYMEQALEVPTMEISYQEDVHNSPKQMMYQIYWVLMLGVYMLKGSIFKRITNMQMRVL